MGVAVQLCLITLRVMKIYRTEIEGMGQIVTLLGASRLLLETYLKSADIQITPNGIQKRKHQAGMNQVQGKAT
jgi:hypothetical protein